MSWSSLLKATFKYGGRAAKATASSVGSAVIHPQRTIKGLGTATKTAAVGGAAAYVGWEKLTTDKSVARIVGDAVVGSDTIDTVSDKVDGVANTVTELKDSVGGAVDTMNNAMTSVDSKWSGMSNFLRGVFSGNGGDMFSNFFSNLGKGNVSGLSLAGLVLSASACLRTFRMARKDSRSSPWHDDDWQQCQYESGAGRWTAEAFGTGHTTEGAAEATGTGRSGG
jgi:hypothetical protein